MMHVCRTHRVALDWLFDRINIDSKSKIRYIDTKHQLADICWPKVISHETNGLHLFNNGHFSSARCAENSSLMSYPETMAKRMQEQKGEERLVATSTSTAMNLSSHVRASSSTAKMPIVSKSPGILTAAGKFLNAGWEEIRNRAQRRVLKWSCKMHTLAGWWTKQWGNLSQQKKNEVLSIFPNVKFGVVMKRK